MISGARLAAVILNGCWPQSQECNSQLYYDWLTGRYLSDFYGQSEYVLFVCTKDEFLKARQER